MSASPLSIWPRPAPFEPRRTPWQPDPGPPRLPSTPSQWGVVDPDHDDWLAQRLLDRRMVTLTGRLDSATANRAVATLALLDASGDDPVELRLCDVDADLDIVLTLLDALDLMSVPVRATCLGELTGPAVAILAVADHRTAGPHATLHLREPRTQLRGHASDVTAHAEDHQRRLRLLQERIAQACHRPVDTVAADMRVGRI
ncbi:MAG: ATP-dependent Clp protease proteolytic subunit, partial [Pseudonocardiales bacterium]|nr:ATP-dependent Clp protease proteolytic subunit [Pseudonocardiales bacterium]